MFRTDLLSIIRSLNTVFTAIGICHTSYAGCLLARSVPSWPRWQTVQIVHLVIRIYHDARSSGCKNKNDVNVRSYIIKCRIPRHFKSDVTYNTTPRITRITKSGVVIVITTHIQSTLHNILGVSDWRLLYLCMVRAEDEETVDNRASNTKTLFYNILSMLKAVSIQHVTQHSKIIAQEL